jgi:hypothetical protein
MKPKLKKPGEKMSPNEWPAFSVGQEFVLNGVRVKVRKLTKKDIILRRVPQK